MDAIRSNSDKFRVLGQVRWELADIGSTFYVSEGTVSARRDAGDATDLGSIGIIHRITDGSITRYDENP